MGMSHLRKVSMRFPLLALALLTGCFAHRGPAGIESYQQVLKGPDHSELDLLKESAEADKIYVQVDLGLDEPALFLLDTGASVTVVNDAVVEALGLEPVTGRGTIQGLGGVTPWRSVVLPALGLGEFEVQHVEAATGVRGVPSFGGGPPLQGILGNDVLQEFVVTVDYPAARMELDRPGQVTLPETATPMLFDGLHCYGFVGLRASELDHQVLLAIDTGARGVLLSGFSGEPLAPLATEGEEALLGIGSGDDLPATGFMRRTRRIPLDRVTIGGVTLDEVGDAQWVNFEGPVHIGPTSMPGLVGHSVLKGHRVVFDYPGERFALLPTSGPVRELEGHRVLLDSDLERNGDDPLRGYYRARLLAWLEDEQQAIQQVSAYLEQRPDDAEATVFLARLHEYTGDTEAYWRVLEPLGPQTLGEQGELVSVVNGLALDGQVERSLDLARAGIDALPARGRTRVAMADALMAAGHYAEARHAIATANRLEESPDGHLLRRARLALAEGDRVAALAHTRRLLEVLPSSGFAIWFYQHLAREDRELHTMRVDLEQAMSRLHERDHPLDFLAAAWTRLGETDRAQAALERGLERDCSAIDGEASRANCEAWYRAMAGLELDTALQRSLEATSEAPHRSDYLDTLAMVRWRRGELEDALKAATEARLRSPADVYLAWQVDRIIEAKKADAEPRGSSG